jgi:LAGLIDADG endonuclease
LHIDDIAVLYIIRDKLGIGIVSIEGKICSFRVHSFQVIVDILLPVFEKYPLLTHKQLNYRDWKKAILLKNLSKKNS